MIQQTPNAPKRGSGRRWTKILAVIVLVPCFLGFGNKFLEFIATYRGEPDGIFVLLPMINYLLATGGFLFLLVWATMHGMFRDVERPKYAMLEQEAMLDAAEIDEQEGDGDDGGAEDPRIDPGSGPHRSRRAAIAEEPVYV